MRCSKFSLFLASILVASPAAAATIDFDDQPAANDPAQTLSEEYAPMGVHFSSTDDGTTWSGIAAGDPGQWQIDGSNGPTFLGFDGGSYSAFVYFDAPVEQLQLDVARASGTAWSYDLFMVVGYRDSAIVDVSEVHLGAVNQWTTISMGAAVDKLYLYGLGFPGYRFGVDNVTWLGDELDAVPVVAIDIRPDSDVNAVNPKSRGVVPVVLFGSDDFDVTQVDPSTLAFGPDGAGLAHRNGPHLEDVDADGNLDLVLHHRMAATGIGGDDVEACLTGETGDGLAFEGCDRVTPLP
jgi:hypothetical protein